MTLSDPHDEPYVADAPFGWDSIEIGFTYRTAERTIEAPDVAAFCAATGLHGRLFVDEDYAKAAGYPASPVPGAMVFAVSDGLVLGTQTWDGSGLAFLESRFQVLAPTLVGDTLHAQVRTVSAEPTSRPERGVVTSHVTVRNQTGKDVMTFEAKRLVKSAATIETTPRENR